MTCWPNGVWKILNKVTDQAFGLAGSRSSSSHLDYRCSGDMKEKSPTEGGPRPGVGVSDGNIPVDGALSRTVGGRTLNVRKCTVAEPDLMKIYRALGTNPAPGGTKKLIS